MRFTRFERKIVTAIFAVAAFPLLGSLVLGRLALRDTYEVGVNARVEAQLEQALDLYRAHFETLRDHAERTADAVARDFELRAGVDAADGAVPLEPTLQGLLSRYPNVARISVETGAGQRLGSAELAARTDESTMRLLEQERSIGGARGALVRVTIATPAAPFRDYQRAGEVVEVYRRLVAGEGFVTLYHTVYIGFLLSVIVIALAIGIVLSRRVTRRVAVLAEATQKVGAGDLEVEVPADARDEVGELSLAFNEMVRDLRESRERIDYLSRIGAWQEFARRLAHEIKNPLTPIQLAVQEVQTGYTGDDLVHRHKLEEARVIVEEEVATLRRLVGEFSAFAKLPQAELSPADLGDFLADLERSLPATSELEQDAAARASQGSPGADPKEVTVTCERPTSPLPVRIDAMMLKRCVDNLVRNAVQAIQREGAGGRVVVRARADADGATLEVCDDGPGVPEQDRARVFDPYFTTRAEGTGLGLAIVKKVVLEHGGEIRCEQAAEGGAAFRVWLPRAEPGRGP